MYIALQHKIMAPQSEFSFFVDYNEKILLYEAIKANDLAMVKELLKNQPTLVNQHIAAGSK